MRGLGTAILLVLAVAPAAAAQNWADTTDDGADSAFAASKAICRAGKAVAAPLPTGRTAPAACSSERLYYGIGQPADPAAALRCAIVEQKADPDNVEAFGGAAMLTTIYANGEGAPRDLDAAIALACTLAGAPAEMDGRVQHLAALRNEGPGPIPFSICDDATSGAMQGSCAMHDSAIAAAERDAALALVAVPWSASDKAAFAKVRAAMEAFATARGGNETDLSGSGRGAFSIEAEDAVRDGLRDIVRGLAEGDTAAKLSLAGEDKAMNVAYATVMADSDPQWGTPTKAGIEATQRLWLAYRDALAAFATGLKGSVAAGNATADLTHRRTSQLREFLR